MSEATARFALPFILPGQAQKEVFHNEALVRIDMALHPSVEGPPLAVPPSAPANGQCWIVGDGAAGSWIGQESRIAMWTESGWRFLAPDAGVTVWQKEAGHWLHWLGTEWSGGELPAASLVIGGEQVVGPRLPTVPIPSGGAVIDAESRTAIAALIATLKSHGLIE